MPRAMKTGAMTPKSAGAIAIAAAIEPPTHSFLQEGVANWVAKIPSMPAPSRPDKLMIRLNETEKYALDNAAAIRGLATASWARSVLLRQANESSMGAALHTSSDEATSGPELLSLFCGPGGLDLGFRRTGFRTRIAFDIDQESVNTFNRNHANGRPVAFRRDLRDLTVDEIFETTGPFQPVGVIGGPPCQSFSVSNVFQSDDDPRHDLPAVYASLLAKINRRHPISFFLFENVPGLLGKRHIHRYEKFKELFREAGFEISERLLDAQNYGVPQQRERIFIIGINRAIHPQVEWRWPPERSERLTVADVLRNLPEPIHNEKGLDASNIPHHPNHWTMVPRSKKFSIPGMLDEGQAWGRSFRTLKWDEPSWTVAYGNREVHVHPNGRRRLSVYEAMLLQSFPPTYQLTGNISSQIRLVSEAVAPQIAFYLALSVRLCLGI